MRRRILVGKKEEIQEIRLGMREAQDGDKEKLETLFLHTMPQGLREFFDLITQGASHKLTRHVLEEVYKNPARFARGFSLDPIIAAEVLGTTSYFVVVGLSVEKKEKAGFKNYQYQSPDFHLRLMRRSPTAADYLVKALGGYPRPSVGRIEQLDALTQAAIENTQQNKTPGLVFSHLIRGVEKALEEISWALYQTAREKIKKEDLAYLFDSYMHRARGVQELTEIKGFLSHDLGAAESRVQFLENEMKEVAEEIGKTGKTIKSPTLRSVRERLEAALPKEPQKGLIVKS